MDKIAILKSVFFTLQKRLTLKKKLIVKIYRPNFGNSRQQNWLFIGGSKMEKETTATNQSKHRTCPNKEDLDAVGYRLYNMWITL